MKLLDMNIKQLKSKDHHCDADVTFGFYNVQDLIDESRGYVREHYEPITVNAALLNFKRQARSDKESLTLGEKLVALLTLEEARDIIRKRVEEICEE